MLVRVVLESYGAAAVSLGPALVRPGTLLRLVLLPTLERIGAVSCVCMATAAVRGFMHRCGAHPVALNACNGPMVGQQMKMRTLQATHARRWRRLLMQRLPASARTAGMRAA